jgi:hypothetical protein
MWCCQEREATRAAVNSGTAESAEFTRRAVAHAEKLRMQGRQERQKHMEDKNLTFNQKVSATLHSFLQLCLRKYHHCCALNASIGKLWILGLCIMAGITCACEQQAMAMACIRDE